MQKQLNESGAFCKIKLIEKCCSLLYWRG